MKVKVIVPPAERRGVRTAESIYVHIGGRVREVRMQSGMTMGALARAVGLSYQQIQKYEKGLNRIPAGHLYAFGRVLGCPPAFFFENFDTWVSEDPDLPTVQAITFEGREFLKAYSNLDAKRQKAILDLMRALST